MPWRASASSPRTTSSRFTLTPLAECLRSDVPGSQRAMAIMAGELFYPAWGELLYSVQTGRTAFEKVYGHADLRLSGQHPEQARLFDETMVGVHGRETAAMLDAYDFSGIRVLADIGGGNGSVLTAVLQAVSGHAGHPVRPAGRGRAGQGERRGTRYSGQGV